MIENRYRLEKQIFLGRQSVRRALQTRAGERIATKVESLPQQPVPPPNTGTKLPLVAPPLSLAPSEEPLPMDTDAEALMINGNSDGRASPVHESSSLQSIPEVGQSRPPPRRRHSRRPSYHRDGAFDGDFGGATPDPPPPPSGSETDRYSARHATGQHSHPVHVNSNLLRRFSKSSLRSAFNSLRRPARPSPSDKELEPEQTWSEDSSSDDDDLSVLSRRRNSMRYPSAFELHTELGRELSDEDGQPEVDQDN